MLIETLLYEENVMVIYFMPSLDVDWNAGKHVNGLHKRYNIYILLKLFCCTYLDFLFLRRVLMYKL